MNPFTMTDETDEDESPSFPSSSDHPRRSHDTHQRRGPMTGSEEHPDGLPSRGINSDSIFRDQSAEGWETPPYERGQNEAVGMSSSNIREKMSDDDNDEMPPDSEIPSIDSESSAPTANQSMYMSYRQSSNGTSRMHRSAESVNGSNGKLDRSLGSSSTPQPFDSGSRRRNRTSGETARKWKGKGRDLGDLGSSASTRQDDPITRSSLAERSHIKDPFMQDSSIRDESASAPHTQEESRSPSVSSIELGTTRAKTSQDQPRDAAVEKRDLLPMPVTSPSTNADRTSSDTRKLASSSLHYSVSGGEVLFEADGQDDQEKTRQPKKPKSERHRHHKKRHHRRQDRVDDEFASDERVYPAEEFDDDPQAMLMSTRSSQNESRAGKRKRTKRRHDATSNLSEREKALWLWANVVDLDGYLQEVIMSGRRAGIIPADRASSQDL